MSVAEAFEKYRSAIEITQEEQDAAGRRHNEIRSYLDETFELETHFLTGSYVRDTKTKPLKDVDIFFVLKATRDNIGCYRSRDPSVVLASFGTALRKKYGDKVSPSGRRSISVDFGPEARPMSFDVVPAFEEGKHYVIPDTTACAWIRTDPKIHERKATEKNRMCNEKWKPLVKMVKGWNREIGKKIRPSFLIEVMALDLVEPEFTNYAYELQMFFANASLAVTKDWPDPADLGPNVNDAMTTAEKAAAASALQEAQAAAAKARRLEDAGLEVEALGLWKRLLGGMFPTR